MACSSEASRWLESLSLRTGERSCVFLSGVVSVGLERRRDARATAGAPSARREAMAVEERSGILRAGLGGGES